MPFGARFQQPYRRSILPTITADLACFGPVSEGHHGMWTGVRLARLRPLSTTDALARDEPGALQTRFRE